MTSDDEYDRALGCLMGLFVGDAAGATLEFFRRPITHNHAVTAMQMQGGGSLNVAPGQFTDDSELAIHLLKALYDKDPTDGIPLSDVAKEYIDWLRSHPFDIGFTCKRAFAFSTNHEDMMYKAKTYSMHSQANGSLMRIAPLAIWCRKMQPDVIMSYARAEATLSHPNVICQDCNAMYCLALSYLIRSSGDAVGAINYCKMFVDCIHPMVAEWFKMSVNDMNLDIDCTINIGHVKYGFILAFHFLSIRASYEDGIRHTLLKGGDTDTNAAIVGAMLGALHGYDGIPSSMKEPMLMFDPSTHDPSDTLLGYRRPSLYCASNAVQYLKDMMIPTKPMMMMDTYV